MHGEQLHLGNQIALALDGRHKRARPSRGIFDKRAGERNAGSIGISNGVGNAGIRHTCDNIRFDVVAHRHFFTAAVAHFFYAHAFIGAGWVAVVYPQKRTDFHLLARCEQGFHAVRCDDINFARSKFFERLVAEILERKVLKRNAVRIFLFAEHDRCSAVFVACGVNALGCQNHHGQRAVNGLQCIVHALDEIFLLVNQRGNQFGRVDFAAAHLKKMRIAVVEDGRNDFLDVVDLADGCDGIGAVVRANNERLRLKI